MKDLTCPRRMDELGPWEHQENLDEWNDRHGHGLTCSFCGSLKPELLFEALEAGNEIVPTDKDYKAYIDPGSRKFYFQHFSEDDEKKFVELLNAKKMKIGYPGYFYTLPFFIERKA